MGPGTAYVGYPESGRDASRRSRAEPTSARIGAIVEGGSKPKMPFPPLAFLAFGVDFGFGRRG
jgi:hypothetical protein